MSVQENIAIGKCLARLRRDRGLTQVELATRIGMPQSFFSKIETGERSLHASEIFAYADALEVLAPSLVEKIGDAPGK